MKWTEEEVEILKKEYAKVDGKKVTNILERLSKKLNRSKNSIRNKAYYLGITNSKDNYTNEQIEFLKENINEMTYTDMSIILKKDKCNICRKCKELNLKKDKKVNTKLLPIKQRYQFTKEDLKKAEKKRKEYIEKNGHPRGYLGYKHSEETRKKLSLCSKKGWENMTKEKLLERNRKQRNTRIKNGTLNPIKNIENCYSRAKGGKRSDLNNQYFRSAWEANIARYFNYLGIEWQYEPKTFVFENITRGSVSYTPDFYLPKTDEWIEVKGWMDGKSKTKLKRFEKQYPEEYKKLKLIQEKEYNEIKKKISMFIKNWE